MNVAEELYAKLSTNWTDKAAIDDESIILDFLSFTKAIFSSVRTCILMFLHALESK